MSDSNDLGDPNNPADAPPPPEGSCPSLCDGNTTNNYWFTEGVCMLDQVNESQVTFILEHNEIARADLRTVTTCEALHHLADTVPRLSVVEEEDEMMKAQAKATPLPFYQLFRGNLNDR